MKRPEKIDKCPFDNNGCEALACYSNEKCEIRDEDGNPMYKIRQRLRGTPQAGSEER